MWFNGSKFLWRGEDIWVEETVDLNLTLEDPEIKSIIQVNTKKMSDGLVTYWSKALQNDRK